MTVTALTGGDAPTGALQPGGTADVVLRVTNPNPYAVTLVSAAANGAVTRVGWRRELRDDRRHARRPERAERRASPPAATTLVDLPAAASMSASSSSGCQGATFTIPVSITVRET